MARGRKTRSGHRSVDSEREPSDVSSESRSHSPSPSLGERSRTSLGSKEEVEILRGEIGVLKLSMEQRLNDMTALLSSLVEKNTDTGRTGVERERGLESPSDSKAAVLPRSPREGTRAPPH